MKALTPLLLIITSLSLMACGTTKPKATTPALTEPTMVSINVQLDTETLAQPSLMFTPGQQAQETIKLNEEDQLKITISPEGDITTVLIRGSEDPTIYKIRSSLGAKGSLANDAFTLTVSSTIANTDNAASKDSPESQVTPPNP